MKSIDECLDIILAELVKNWDKPNNERHHLNAEYLLNRFDLPSSMQKHEFFKRLIDKLIKENYAEFIQNESTHYKNSIEHYQENTVITIEGYHFISEPGGGYKNKSIHEKNDRVLRGSRDKRLSNGTVYLAIGTFLIVAWELLKFFYYEGHSLCR